MEYSNDRQFENFSNYQDNNHNINVERILLERGTLFNTKPESNKNKYNDEHNNRYNKNDIDDVNSNSISINNNNIVGSGNNHSKKKYIKNMGEITGETFNTSNIEKGMPIRSRMITKKTQQLSNNRNPQLDFDVYDDNLETADDKVNYNDPMESNINMGMSTFSDIFSSAQKLSPLSETNEMSTLTLCSRGINNFSSMFLQQIQSQMRTSFCISPFCLYTFMAGIYMCSNGNSQKNICNYMSFPDKNILHDGIYEIATLISKSRVGIFKNIYLLGPGFNINNECCKYMDNIIIVDQINKGADNKYKTINKWINDMTANNVDSVINESTLSTKNISSFGINVCYIKPKWELCFLKKHTSTIIFKGLSQRDVPSLNMYNQPMAYYADKYNQCIEMKFTNINFVCGIILPKVIAAPNINNDYIINISNKFSYVPMKHICIPKFKHQNKFKLKKLLKQNSSGDIFSNVHLSELLTGNIKSTRIDEINHITTFIMSEGENAHPNKMSNKSTPECRTNFIADHPFFYYVKYMPSNTIILNGVFY